ncbi:MAG: Fe-S cluster assembly protein SufD [Candidatus Nanopelagicales bacterium]
MTGAGEVLLSGLAPGRGGDVPAWLSEVRSAALTWVTEHGFPTHRDEDWKYTQLGPITDMAFRTSTVDSGDSRIGELVPDTSLDLGGIRLVFVNGLFSATMSRLATVPDGITVTNVATLLASGEQEMARFFDRAPGQYHAFAALNDALAEDGAFIHLGPGTVVDEPIQLVFLSDTGGVPLLASPRSVVLAEAGSRATIVETYAGIDGQVCCTNSVTEVVLHEGAQIDHYKVQDEPESAFHLALLDVRQGRDSRFGSHLVMLGSQIARHEVRISLDAPGAEVSLDGLYLPQGEQVHDNTVFVDHASTQCTSHQLYKGVLADRGHGIFNGHIMVRNGSDGTDANQKNKNLILSDRAEVDTRPRLEIYADDVKCTHGAAVGQIDQEAVLYLRSRGLSADAARGLLVYAFVKEMVDRVELPDLRSALLRRIAARSMAGIGEVGA